MAAGLEAIAALPDPVGRVLAAWQQPNGLKFERVSVPIGVIGIIYESRPNVTADAGGLCLKSGNAALLRGGSESFTTSRLIAECLRQGLAKAGLPQDAIQFVPTTDREAVGHMLRLPQYIDVIVPRGGKSLIERVMAESRIPVFAHLEGLCHVYVDKTADLAMARDVVVNAKLRAGYRVRSHGNVADRPCGGGGRILFPSWTPCGRAAAKSGVMERFASSIPMS